MRTLSELCPILADATNQSLAHVKNVGAALREGDVLPVSHGRGSCPEVLSLRNVTDFTVATVLGERLRNVAKMTRIYSGLLDEHGNTAGEQLAALIDSCVAPVRGLRNGSHVFPIDGARITLNTSIQIETSFPRINFATEANDGSIHKRVFGPIKDRDSTYVGIRSFKIISGQVLFNIAKAL